MTYNAFTAVKKKYTTTPSTSGSTYQNAYANYGTTAGSPYSTINKTTSTTTPASTTQSVAVPYANANYIKQTPTTKTTTTYNAFTPSSAVDTYAQQMRDLYKQQQEQLATQRQQAETSTNKNYDYAKQYYESQIPTLQSNFSAYETNANADIAALQESAARQKASTKNEYLAAQRDALAAQRENEANTMQEFAALGTIDSGGVGSYSRARENIQTESNRYRQENNLAMANALADIDDQLGQAERTAQQAILTERNNLESAIQQINFQLGSNELARQNALNEVLGNYQSSVSSIQNQLNEFEYSLLQQAEDAKKSQLSEAFMTTGVPQTETDYRYMVENAGNYEKMANTQSTGVVSDADKQTASDISTLVNEVLSDRNALAGITGFWRGGVLTTGGQTAKAKLERIANLLTVKARGALKGQGQISDAETKMLASAQSILNNRAASTDEIVNELYRIQEEANNVLQGNTSYTNLNQSYNSDSLSNDQISSILSSLGY